ncbi:peptidoglycan D,D-transpeptidase FtsI family protein [Anaerosinus massiliensis]|uniref:peptidoglycan D,D-transpeptidase FtsI family protein n=1 Tax=Massilibacillus massiliensis TaxID=1806837 RepID=UPI000ACB187E|nr:penicillin-binding transpeptidase domain-containing protein [Massilibacillus massiliensis]
MHNDDVKNNIFKVAVFLFSWILILIFYITYIQIVMGTEISNHPLNKRNTEYASNIQRGNIIAYDGTILAYSEKKLDGGYIRKYPLKEITAHIVGFESAKLGNTGIEAGYNSYLSGTGEFNTHWGAIQKLIKKEHGYNIVLTIDTKLQEIAARSLGDRNGAIIVLNPKNGAILAMVSRPGFDPNSIDQSWDKIQNDTSAVLLNRGTQGLYPPGSIFKTVILEAALTEDKNIVNATFNCPGYLKISDDYTLFEDHHAVHGNLSLKEALTVSCNTTFATLALKLGPTKLDAAFQRFGFGKALESKDFTESQIKLPPLGELNNGDLSQIGIGQGQLLVTPLRMALVTSAFANNGTIMRPHLLHEIRTVDGDIIKEFHNEKWLEVTNKETSNIISEFMESVVQNGTGSAARIQNIRVAGKTGTAENSQGQSHAWFIGFAPLESPEIVVVVLVENSGSGGKVAAPIAKKIISSALK